ncbi:MAG: hypothetical protein QP756_02450 [Lactobacillus crispatus]|uniref:hypothetical protein n=1 Tax=Lactobacillus crispatus TaxID=47770 RepID=UPI000A5D03F9|nr:hypothetical protein [Lactobacillus crispatus]MDK7319785.1 hypothetical protein [Lactobacillus crispatus]MDK8272252.1 hypothetical protein [Lactobacillus crispatus]MDK8568320.1 hypothetical protein [Lactobacillus crispatus]
MKRIIISKDEVLLSGILGGSGSVDDIGLTDTEHMLPLYSKKGGNHNETFIWKILSFSKVLFIEVDNN